MIMDGLTTYGDLTYGVTYFVPNDDSGDNRSHSLCERMA